MSNQNEIPITSFDSFVCNSAKSLLRERCSGELFTSVTQIKTYKGFQSQNQLVIARIELFKCIKCGEIHDFNKPKAESHGGLTLNEL